MFCPECGKELPAGAKFCVACGGASPDTTTVGAARTQANVRSPVTTLRTNLPREAPTATESAPPVATPDSHPETAPTPASDGRASRRFWRRPADLIAVLAAVLVVVGIAGYEWSLHAKDAVGSPPSNAASSASGISPPSNGTTWSGLDPAEVAAARRAFDQRVADEEREASERAQ